MQMIDVLKRLAELDAKNPNVVKESFDQKKYNITNVSTFKNRGSKSIASAKAYDPSDEGDSSFPVIIVISKRDFGVMPSHHDYSDEIEVFNSSTKENITDLVDLGSLDLEPNYRDRFDPNVAESDALEGSTKYGAWDPDYGPYRGEPGDPRTPEVSDDEESYEVNKEWLNVLQNADDPVNIDELPNADLIDHIKHEAQRHNVDLSDQSQVDNLIGKIMDDLEDEIKSWENINSSSDEPDFDDDNYIVREGLEECGDSMMGYNQPKTPASINMTAGSGEELSAMLKDIMSLAGLKQVGPGDMERAHEPSVMSTPPTISIASMDDEPEFMRSMIDKLNEPGEDDKVVKELDNTPDEEILDARSGPLGLNGFASSDQSGPPGGGDGRKVVSPRAHVETTYESLMSEYKKFISEDQGMAEGGDLGNREEKVDELKDTTVQSYANAAKRDYNKTNAWARDDGMGPYRTRKTTDPDHWSTRSQEKRVKGLARAKDRGITPEKPSSGKHVPAGDRLRSDSRGSMGSGIKREGLIAQGQQGMAEEKVDEIGDTEKGREKLKNYMSWAKLSKSDHEADARDARGNHIRYHSRGDLEAGDFWDDEAKRHDKLAKNREIGMSQADYRIRNKGMAEEKVDELKDTTVQSYANAAKKDYNKTNTWARDDGMGPYRTRKTTDPDHWSTRSQEKRVKGLARAKDRGITPEKPSSGKHVPAGDRLRSDSRGSMGSGIKREGLRDPAKMIGPEAVRAIVPPKPTRTGAEPETPSRVAFKQVPGSGLPLKKK